MEPIPRRKSDDRFEQLSRNLIRWVLGTGLLSVHLAAFFLTMVALLLWNYARSPDNLWVAEPLRRWGLVVVFHATAVTVGWTAWRLMRLGQTAPDQPINQRAVRRWQPSDRLMTQSEPLHVQTIADASSTATAEEWARKWLRSSVRIVRDAVGPRTVSNGHEGNTNGKGTSPVGTETTEWGALFVRRAREMMISAKEHISPQDRSDSGGDNPANGNGPGNTWPSSGLSQSLSEGLQSPAGNGTWPEVAPGGLNMVDPTPPSAEGNPSQAQVQENGYATSETNPSRASSTPEDDASAEEARWTWVESAAAAWMTRNEADEPAAKSSEATPASDTGTTPSS